MELPINSIIQGDCLEVMKGWPDDSIDCCITSPPYWGLRDYGVEGQIGLEKTPEEYVSKMVEIFKEVRRVLKPDGTCWLNLGDSYGTGTTASRKQSNNVGVGANTPEAQNSVGRCGGTAKQLIGIPWRVAFALQADGWWLRQDIIWAKPNPMPESVTDRCTKAHEYIFLLTKSGKYYYDAEAIKEDSVAPGSIHVSKRGQKMDAMAGGVVPQHDIISQNTRNKRSVWTVIPANFKESHFATFPEKLIEPMVKAGCPEGGIILDPFGGACTTAVVAYKNKRNYIMVELKPQYIEIGQKRVEEEKLKLSLFDTCNSTRTSSIIKENTFFKELGL